MNIRKKAVQVILVLLMLTTVFMSNLNLGYANDDTRAIVNRGDILISEQFKNNVQFEVSTVVRRTDTKEMVPEGIALRGLYYDQEVGGTVIKEEVYATGPTDTTYNFKQKMSSLSNGAKRVDVVLDETLDYSIERGSSSYNPISPKTMRYDAAGGTFSTGYEFNSIRQYYGEPITLYDDYEIPTREGGTFLYWLTNAGVAWNELDNLEAGDAPFTAKWKMDVYTISFETNGGTPVNPLSNVEHGSLLVEPESPTKVGHTFAGWYHDEALTQAWNFDNDKISGAVTLYAKWTPEVYTIRFVSNGGTTVQPITNAPYGQLLVEPDEPFRDGFGFGAWYKDALLTDIWDFDHDVVTEPITLYASWNESIYTVEFESNGGTPIAEIQDVHHGTTIPAPTPPTRPGYTFKNWYSDPALKTKWDFKKHTVTNDMTLYAAWNEVKYTVTFETGGGTPVAPIKNVKYDQTIKEPAAPHREGYGFDGWYHDATFTRQWNFATDTVTDDTVLHALWDYQRYNVMFESYGGTPVATIEDINHGEKVPQPADPIREGYQFVGWYHDDTLTQKWDFETELLTKDTTLHAKWLLNSYQVHFQSNGGTVIPSTTTEHGMPVTKPIDPIRIGYTFDGWYQNKDLSTPWNFDKDYPTSEMTLYAKWNLNTYTVSFETYGGTEVPSTTVSHGEKVSQPHDPIRDGYRFVGWYQDEGLMILWDFEMSSVDEALTLHAKWNPADSESGSTNDTVSVYFDSNGGSNVTTLSGLKKDTLILQPEDPQRDGYTFDGWYTDASLTRPWNFEMDTVHQTMTLYAKWGPVNKTPDVTTSQPSLPATGVQSTYQVMVGLTFILMGITLKHATRKRRNLDA
ncbi:InlB B-repeat-containing protein [Erysipelothrix aquatica]|uniref:InlB B-repeat-containing protein n=1 Tax=Erysipelothrix aquatica TaxID=2683714 RepID=UPI00135B4D1C|nr:InlB B-repeat-containing protein [Erysipelothrix aquatica]